MDERRELRFESDRPVKLTILGSSSQDVDQQLPAYLVNVSGRGISLATKCRVPINSAVRLDVDDSVLLGEVCHSREAGPSEFICGIRLEQALTAVGDLSKLVSGIMGEMRQAEAPAETRGSNQQLTR